MEHMNIVGHPYQSKQQLASACSEIIEDLLRKTYDEENPFERFNEELPSYGPNTLENSMSIEQREQTDSESTNFVLDGTNDVVYRRDLDASNSLVQSINSLRGSCGDNHERHNYVSHCLHSMVNNNVKIERSMEKDEEESFDGEYLENLRGQNENIVAESESDKGLPDTSEEVSDEEDFEVEKSRCCCKDFKYKKAFENRKKGCKKVDVIDEVGESEENLAAGKLSKQGIKTCVKNNKFGESSQNTNTSLTIFKPKKVSFEETSSSHLGIGITDSERELLTLMDNRPQHHNLILNETSELLVRQDSTVFDRISMQNGLNFFNSLMGNEIENDEIYRLEGLYAQGDIKRYDELNSNVSVEVSFGICTKIVAFFLTINTLFLMKYIIVDIALAYLPL